jgi:uncharacterized protein (TIGR03437 family)
MYYAGADGANPPTFSPNSSQINFQIPSSTPAGANVIAVRKASTGELLAGGTFSVASVGPGLFTQNAQGFGPGSIINGDGVTLNSASNLAAPGSVVSLYGTGQGATNPAVPDGQSAPSSPLAWALLSPGSSAQSCSAPASVCVLFNDSVFGAVQYWGLAPGFVGLWQINVQIPASAPTGNAVPVKVTVGGVSSNTVTMAIK